MNTTTPPQQTNHSYTVTNFYQDSRYSSYELPLKDDGRTECTATSSSLSSTSTDSRSMIVSRLSASASISSVGCYCGKISSLNISSVSLASSLVSASTSASSLIMFSRQIACDILSALAMTDSTMSETYNGEDDRILSSQSRTSSAISPFLYTCHRHNEPSINCNWTISNDPPAGQ
jgi:hypothetical protein